MSTIPLVYPSAAPPGWRKTIEDAAREGNSTFYATGSEPGFASLNVPTALLTGAGRVDAYRMDLYAIRLDEQYPMAVFNAIPSVVAAEPGIVEQPLAGPAVVTRRAQIHHA